MTSNWMDDGKYFRLMNFDNLNDSFCIRELLYGKEKPVSKLQTYHTLPTAFLP